MTDVSEILLMRYADGEVDKAERRAVEDHLAANPGARNQLAAFEATGRRLGDACRDALDLPIPQALLDTIATSPMAVRRVAVEDNISPWRRIASLFGFETLSLMPVAFACAAALAIGGYALRGAVTQPTRGTPLLVVTDGRTDAGRWLAAALDATASGQTLTGDNSGQMVILKPVLSFVSTANTMCRQFDVSATDGGFTAVGCKQRDGRWQIEAQAANVAVSGSSSAIKPASGQEPSAIDAVVDTLITGDVMTPALEAEAIARGWKK
jgi:hypothetical protein